MAIQTSYGLYYDVDLQTAWGSEFSIDFVVPLELVSQWRRCGLVADFLANYHSFHFQNPKKALMILSTIINELLENAVKFSKDKNKLVTLSLRHSENSIFVETINVTDESNAARLDGFIFRLNQSDPESLFFEQIEECAVSDHLSSGLGLLTILKDYEANLGVKIAPKIDDTELHEVAVTVAIQLDSIDSICR